MQLHPFLNQDNSPYQTLPSQNLSLKKKTKDWREANMDAIDNIARIQFFQKQALLNNYKMVNGELVVSDYIPDEQDTFSLLDHITDDNRGELESFRKHYDIISQPMAVLEGELTNYPDVFNIVGRGDMMESERMKVKTQMLREWFSYTMNKSIQDAITPSESDAMFAEEEQQEVEQAPMTPPEIEKYMSTSYKHLLELWAQYELKDQFERFRLKALRREEFHHYLVTGERFRHIFKDANGLKVESLNPVYTFVHKSPVEKYVQNGDIAGTVQIRTVTSVIDMYGHLMTDKQLNALEEPYDGTNDKKDKGLGTDISGKRIPYLSPLGIPYQTRVPTLNPVINNLFPSAKNMNGSGGYYFTETEMSKVNGWGDYFYNTTRGMLVVIKGYWKSQLRIGKLTWINPSTGLYEVIEVDENFVAPDYIKHIKDEKYNYVGQLNTIVWTRITEVWEGIKITNYSTEGFLKEPMYLDIKPADIQIGRLPICGQFANNINTKPTGFVAKIKNFQWLYNILMNQVYQFVVNEWLPFVAMDTRLLPKDKDWGGPDGLEKWSEIGQEGGAAPVDSSPENLAGSRDGGQYPRMIDLDRSARIITRLNLATAIRQLALEQVGIYPQRLGETRATETASGIAQATTASATQTASWFADFFECENEVLQFQIDAAKYLQAQNNDYSAMYVKSDMSLETLRFSLEDGDLYDLHVYVSNSQEELRKLQTAQRLALENNTSEIMMSDRIEMSVNSSYLDILTGLKASEEKMIARQQQELQMKQQELQQAGMDAQAARDTARENLLLELQNKLDVATLNAMGREKGDDMNANGISDILEFNKAATAYQGMLNTAEFNNAKLGIEREKNEIAQSLKEKEFQDRREQRRHEQYIEKQQLKRDTIRGDKSK